MTCCQIDRTFYKTIPFYLKVLELSFCIPIWICVASVSGFPQYGGGGFINFCTTISFVFTAVLFLFYLFGVIQKLPGPWILIEVCTIVGSVVLYLISLIIAAASHGWGGAIIAASVFCAIDMILYAVEFFLRFKVMRLEGFQFTAHLKSTEGTGTSNTIPDNKGGPYIIGA